MTTMLQATELLRYLIEANRPTMLHGTYGLGKSKLVYQIAAALGMPVIEFRPSLHESIDLRGLPVTNADTGATDWLRPSHIPFVGNAGPDVCVLFIDEINAALSQSMAAALYGLILDRRVGEHKLKPGVRIVCAGNLSTDKAIVGKMGAALESRMEHIVLEKNLDSWIAWALGNGIDPVLIAFLQWKASQGDCLLHSTIGRTVDAPQSPNPRAWERISYDMSHAPEALRLDIMTATIGEHAATELEAFIRIYRDLPKLKEIENDPMGTRLPSTVAGMFALSSMLANKATATNIDAIIRYASRMSLNGASSRDLEIMIVVDIAKRHPALQATPAFVTWALNNKDVTLG